MTGSLGLMLLQYDDGGGAAAAFAALFTGVWLFVWLIVAILMIAGMWKMFAKAGKPGWYSLIPILNVVALGQIVGWSTGKIIGLFIPIVNIVLGIMLYADLAKSFGKGTGFTLGLIFFPYICFAILGFGDARYLGPPPSSTL